MRIESLMLSYKIFKEKAILNVLPWSNQKQIEVKLVLEKPRTRVAEGTAFLQLPAMGRNQAQVNIGMSWSYVHA